MMYNATMYFRKQENKSIPLQRQFQLQLQDTPKLHTIKTKLIASYRVDIYTEQSLCNQFKNKYRPALEFISVYYRNRIYNINKKGARIACLIREEVVVPIGIKEIYVKILENRLFITIVKCIFANGKSILLLVIILSVIIIKKWFYKKIIKHKLVIISLSGYTNKGICLIWLDHFIKHNNCKLNKEQHILLINSATCYKVDKFILIAKINKI